MLRDGVGAPFTTGVLRFRDSSPERDGENAKIWVPLTFVDPRGVPITKLGLLDTGADYSVLDRDLAGLLDLQAGGGYPMTYSTRFGSIEGALQRVEFTLVDEGGGQDLEAEATFFVSADWPGPTILGYNTALSDMRFALEPRENWFHFGAN